MIYLDHAATTPLAPEVLDAMLPWLREGFGNPASLTHGYGRAALQAVDTAREELAVLIGAEPREITWTSGATESNNLAIKGVAEAYADRGKHLITLRTEHKSVLDPLRHLEQQGWRVTWLTPGADGLIDPTQIEAALTSQTVLVSVMRVNNEIGVIQDIPAIAKVVHTCGALLHVDAAQALGKIPVNVGALDADLISFSAHKLYGPKGIGALYVRRNPRPRLIPQIHGGGHERGLRSGTLPTHQIAGFGAACRLAHSRQADEATRLAHLRDELWQRLQGLSGVYLNGHPQQRVAHILNVSVAGVDGEALFAALELEGLAVAAGSACTAASGESSYVLRALGRDDELAYASVRFSLGETTTPPQIDQTADIVSAQVNRLRALSPLWPTQVRA